MADSAVVNHAERTGLAPSGGRRDLAPAGLAEAVEPVLAVLASLKVTVVLFALSLVLVFFGTIAQVDEGIWTVVSKYFRSWTVVWVPWQIFASALARFALVSPETKWAGSFPFPGGWLLGSSLMINLLAAHAVRFKVSWKRSGILLIHSGVVVMMLSEFIAGVWQVEGNMTIDEGSSSSYLEHNHVTELAVIDTSGPKTDDVVAVPQSILRRGGLIQHDLLPFHVHVDEYMVNSRLAGPIQVGPDVKNRATAGDGTGVFAVPAKEVSGTDQGETIDLASTYITLTNKRNGEPIGTYLVSVFFYLQDRPQQVTVNGKTFDLWLRFKRTYKPYTLHLIDFKHDKYIGTDKAKNFSSLVRLDDPTRSVDREVTIYMNHPLRHAGETFYQSSFKPGDTGTILQVVRNPGWLLPYISCGMVSLGMIVHFGLALIEFLRRRGVAGGSYFVFGLPSLFMLLFRLGAARAEAVNQSRRVKGEPEPEPDNTAALFAWGLAIAVTAYLLLQMRAPSESGSAQLQEFGRIPVVFQGRVKPLDTLARNSLMIISKRQTYTDENGRSQPAIRWLADVMSERRDREGERVGDKYKIFRVENDEVLDLLGLERRPGSYRYSIAEFRDKLQEFERQAKLAHQVDDKQRTLYQRKVLELANQLSHYMNLVRLEIPLVVPPRSDAEEWLPYAEVTAEARQVAFDRIRADAAREGVDLKTLPIEELRTRLGRGMEQAVRQISPFAVTFGRVLEAYADDDAGGFNQFVADYHRDMEAISGVPHKKVEMEVFFNRFEPFYHCSLLYLVAALTASLGWLVWSGPLNRGAFLMLIPTLVVHTFALVGRMYLQGRPPVTNLYSSAVFIGYGCVIIGMMLEWIYSNGIGNVIAGVTGFSTLIIAHFLSLDGNDTMEMMQAVLDTNFWLATHVTCVTIGYAATFKAGFLAMLFIFRGLFTRSMNAEAARTHARMIYGVVCFAMLLSFTGTVLGGIWADQSWGRFWGWDPKENGALMIVIWNALILHARWGGMIKPRGLACLAVGGNIITAWSWFGTNLLGVGLHAYGGGVVETMKSLDEFMKTPHFWLCVFALSQFAIIGIGLIPKRLWRSFQAEPVSASATA